jgi:hypothetical protein
VEEGATAAWSKLNGKSSELIGKSCTRQYKTHPDIKRPDFIYTIMDQYALDIL